MLKLRKIPLQPLIEILQDLYDSGADYIDLSGEQSKEGEDLKDIIHITVKPEYILHEDDDDDDDIDNNIQEVKMDYSDDNTPDTSRKSLSDEDINDLI
jgi:hypothetical protein